jgi:peptidoglycan/LPS O-acetylase OafA/YrhL
MNQGLLLFCITLCSAGLKGFQHKNVIHNRIKTIAVISYLMAFVDMYFIKQVTISTIEDNLIAATGAALGMIISVCGSNFWEKLKSKK